MNATQASGGKLRLSICIATFTRAEFIGQTLDSILPQLRDDVELVVVDGASPDATPDILSRYAAVHQRLRYVRESTNSGIDADYDKAVSYARGEFCWLMTDDDLMVEGAIERVLSHIDGVDLVVVNSEVRNKDLARVLRPRMLQVTDDQAFADSSGERLFAEVAAYLSFIGGVVVRRDLWLRRERRPYYGTLFVHLGVLFQSPALSRAFVIADPLLIIRFGNAMWTSRSFEIWMFKWPQLIWSFGHFSPAARAKVTTRYPFRELKRLLFLRAVGSYSTTEYRAYLSQQPAHFTKPLQALIARLPGKAANFLCGLYYLLRPNKPGGMELYDLARAVHATSLTQRVASAKRNAA